MKLCIKEKLDEKQISRYKLAKILNVTYPTATLLYYGNVSSVRLETIEKLCQILECMPNDILAFDSKANKV